MFKKAKRNRRKRKGQLFFFFFFFFFWPAVVYFSQPFMCVCVALPRLASPGLYTYKILEKCLLKDATTARPGQRRFLFFFSRIPFTLKVSKLSFLLLRNCVSLFTFSLDWLPVVAEQLLLWLSPSYCDIPVPVYLVDILKLIEFD